MRKLLNRLKFPIIIILMFGTCVGLTFLFNALCISVPWILSGGLLLVAILGDYATTLVAFKLGGQEGNPLVRLLFQRIGAKKGGLIILALFCVFILFPYRNLPSAQQLAMSITYFIVPINNLFVIRGRRKQICQS